MYFCSLQKYVSIQLGSSYISTGEHHVIPNLLHYFSYFGLAFFFVTVSSCYDVLFPYEQYRTSSISILKPKPTVSQSESTTRRALIYGIQDDNGTDIQNFALDLTPPPDVLIRTKPGNSDGMNVLGIVIFSATMGKKKINSCVCLLKVKGKTLDLFFVCHQMFKTLVLLQESCWEGWVLMVVHW